MLHRVEIHGLEIANRQEWERRQDPGVDAFELSTTTAAHFESSVLPFFIGRVSDEGPAVFSTVDARVGRHLPG